MIYLAISYFLIGAFIAGLMLNDIQPQEFKEPWVWGCVVTIILLWPLVLFAIWRED